MAIFGKNEKELKELEKNLDMRERSLNKLQGSLERKKDDLKNREKIDKEKAEELSKKDADLGTREKDLSQKELDAKNNFVKQQREAFKEGIDIRLKQLDGRSKELDKRQKDIEARFAELIEIEGPLANRERKIKEEELKAKNGFADENRIALREIEKLETELDSIRKKHEIGLQKEKAELQATKEEMAKKQATLDELQDKLDYQKQRLQSRKEALEEREANLNIEVDAKVVERKQSFESEKSVLSDEIARLRESIKTSSSLLSNFEELKHKLGDEDPATVLLKLKTHEEEIKKLREDLATRPTQEMQEAFDRLKKEQTLLEQACSTLSEENVLLKRNAQEQSQLKLKISELEAEKKSYKQRFESVDADNTRLNDELKRLQAAYARESDYEKRKINIEKPYIEKEIQRNAFLKAEAGEFLKLQATKKRAGKLSKDEEQKYSELDNAIGKYEQEWLDGISNSSIDYGLRFPRRILHAFHTALKTSEWSPVTVLAGVSGTGKSELPRLYSHFGGINFLSLSVQPNWDSQESMLGFFNSIDNEFDAQEVLRFLVQSQRKQTSDNPFGLEDAMSLILMDEMNLAHVELYFAEFLSKLERRRGLKENDVPSLPVKLGVGSDFIYPLSLGRNVLWAGTMNQDETTKSLSDKVLDRGIVINFPRPTTLERRRKLTPLGEQAPLLSRKLWESWWCRESNFKDGQILPFKGFVEEMNTSLSKVGRALGHRVWQSIEYYMSNYPDVLNAQRNNDDAGLVKAMKIAFEDQLVQKVMPKLRGIETRGKSKSDCLDKIRTQLVNDDYTIIEDFDLACEFGYGQFIWNSANYIKEDDQSTKADLKSNDT